MTTGPWARHVGSLFHPMLPDSVSLGFSRRHLVTVARRSPSFHSVVSPVSALVVESPTPKATEIEVSTPSMACFYSIRALVYSILALCPLHLGPFLPFLFSSFSSRLGWLASI